MQNFTNIYTTSFIARAFNSLISSTKHFLEGEYNVLVQISKQRFLSP